MGNCQAAEVATMAIHHPNGRVERLYWSVTASHVMASNPGHYLALIVTTTNINVNGSSSSAAPPLKHLKLLRPDDTLYVGHAYQLVSFEEVLREFASKKDLKLSKLPVTQKDHDNNRSQRAGGLQSSYVQVVERQPGEENTCDRRRSGGATACRSGQWRPALQSIAETHAGS